MEEIQLRNKTYQITKIQIEGAYNDTTKSYEPGSPRT